MIFLYIYLLPDFTRSMMDDFDFTEEEIREQLKKLGYSNIPDERLTQFKTGKFTYYFFFYFIMSVLSFTLQILL